ncbi:MAG: coenzyme F420-0:L-glutamate ligase [Candidatus Bathyarchaeota archaeon]|jgi:F420-0:gamma-glutamyl ligase-like protein|nr:coenzyme F420-0:L-glutamate ligase [Candidatus Bathyarchaeota archaeon]
MTKYSGLALGTKYWKPGDDYLNIIIDTIRKSIKNNDFVVVSEKALAIAEGNYIDESSVNASLTAKVISRFWMRIVWGHILGTLCHFGKRLVQRLKEYPIDEGSQHKQAVLQQTGFWQALMWGSEGGIDGSNLPYAYVCLPLERPYKMAEKISQKILKVLNKRSIVIIVDTDKTYTFRNFHFTPHPKPMRGIQSFGGWITYLIGRAFRLKKKSTPLAVSGGSIHVEKALKIANIADRIRGTGSGATVWDMATRFKVKNTEISWKMLESLNHKPIVLIRERK